MRRKRLSDLPSFEGVIENWSKSYIRKNFWRVERLYDYEDLLQDAYLKYIQCYRRYRYVVDSPHFMSLYKTAFKNHINDLSKNATVTGDVDAPEPSHLDEHFLYAYLSQAPAELKQFLEVLSDEKFCKKLRNYKRVTRRSKVRKNKLAVVQAVPSRLKSQCTVLTYKTQLDYIRCICKPRFKSTFKQRPTFNQVICDILEIDSSKVNVVNQIRDYLR